MIKPANETSVEVEIMPFSVPGNTHFVISVSAYLTIDSVDISSVDYATIVILPSPLYVYINGGNRIVGFSVSLEIQAEARDPDVFGGV